MLTFVAVRCSCGYDVVKFLSLLYYLSFLNVASWTDWKQLAAKVHAEIAQESSRGGVTHTNFLTHFLEP